MKLHCHHCQKELFTNSQNHYNIPLCRACLKTKIHTERQVLLKYFMWMGVWTIFMIFVSFAAYYESPREILLKGILMGFLGGICQYNGWRFLDNFKEEHIPIPILGTKLYYSIKIIFAMFFGFLVTPFVLFKKIRKWRELDNTLSYL